jgi:hypothetical protein
LVDAESGNVNVLGCRGSALVFACLALLKRQSILAEEKADYADYEKGGNFTPP